VVFSYGGRKICYIFTFLQVHIHKFIKLRTFMDISIDVFWKKGHSPNLCSDISHAGHKNDGQIVFSTICTCKQGMTVFTYHLSHKWKNWCYIKANKLSLTNNTPHSDILTRYITNAYSLHKHFCEMLILGMDACNVVRNFLNPDLELTLHIWYKMVSFCCNYLVGPCYELMENSTWLCFC
jgi:hypothetical protein